MIEPKLLMTIFTTVFLAELGDKTQLATMLFSAQNEGSRMAVFVTAALALALACAIGVLAGALIGRYLHPRTLARIAGAGFILIGLWTLVKA